MSFYRSQPEEEKKDNEDVVLNKQEQEKPQKQDQQKSKQKVQEVEEKITEQENVESPTEKELFYLNLAQRVQAEFENYRKRTREAEIEARERGIKYSIENLLPIADSILNAKNMLKDDSAKNAISAIEMQLIKCFENLGVKKIEALNKPFDPNLHNAIMTGEDANFDSDIILEVFQDGFTLNDKVIRHSVVKVNK